MTPVAEVGVRALKNRYRYDSKQILISRTFSKCHWVCDEKKLDFKRVFITNTEKYFQHNGFNRLQIIAGHFSIFQGENMYCIIYVTIKLLEYYKVRIIMTYVKLLSLAREILNKNQLIINPLSIKSNKYNL